MLQSSRIGHYLAHPYLDGKEEDASYLRRKEHHIAFNAHWKRVENAKCKIDNKPPKKHPLIDQKMKRKQEIRDREKRKERQKNKRSKKPLVIPQKESSSSSSSSSSSASSSSAATAATAASSSTAAASASSLAAAAASSSAAPSSSSAATAATAASSSAAAASASSLAAAAVSSSSSSSAASSSSVAAAASSSDSESKEFEIILSEKEMKALRLAFLSVFIMCSADWDQRIDTVSLRRTLTRAGIRMRDANSRRALSHADIDRDGTVKLNDFMKVMTDTRRFRYYLSSQHTLDQERLNKDDLNTTFFHILAHFIKEHVLPFKDAALLVRYYYTVYQNFETNANFTKDTFLGINREELHYFLFYKDWPYKFRNPSKEQESPAC